jgi:hypothetical protein
VEGNFLDARIVERRDMIERGVEIRKIQPRLVLNGEAGQVRLRTNQGRRIEHAKDAIHIVATGAEFDLAIAVDCDPKTSASLRPAALTDDVMGFGFNAVSLMMRSCASFISASIGTRPC